MTRIATALPHLLPGCTNARLALFAIRRMGAHGLDDAAAAHALFTGFRRGFLGPLLLTRALMAELATTAAGPIAIASCCCPRMTAAEGVLLSVLARAETEPDAARLLLADLLSVRRADGALATAAALAAAFADEGRPVT